MKQETVKVENIRPGTTGFTVWPQHLPREAPAPRGTVIGECSPH